MNPLLTGSANPRLHSNSIAHRVRRKRQGFLLVSLSKTARIDSCLTRSLLPEAFPIKASDHSPTDQRKHTILLGAALSELASAQHKVRLRLHSAHIPIAISDPI